MSIALAVALAFLFGYSLTLIPLMRGGMALGAAIAIALAADTLSIATMEIVDNAALLLLAGGRWTRTSTTRSSGSRSASRSRSRSGKRSS